MNWSEFKSFMKAPWKIKKQWSLYRKVVFKASIPSFDEFISDDMRYHEYVLSIEIVKHYTLQGVRYCISVPGYSTSGFKSIYPLIWEIVTYLDKNSPGYDRLKDRLELRGLWGKV